MKNKKVRGITRGSSPHQVGNGFTVSNYLPGPSQYSQETSPFYLLDYNAPMQVSPTTEKLGVGEHPHRGFETVTIVKSGSISHRDSSGGGGVIHAGDVQWMTAGAGVLHEEFLDESFTKDGGTQHFLQLWVNLPAKYKMTPPKYQNIASDSIPRVALDKNGSFARVIAGHLENQEGPAKTFTPIELYELHLEKGATYSFSLPATYNSMLLVSEGKVAVNGSQALNGDFVLFERNGEDILLEALANSDLLVLSGEPLNEPIATYGPFLMNTKQEVQQALEDYRSGRFGSIQR